MKPILISTSHGPVDIGIVTLRTLYCSKTSEEEEKMKRKLRKRKELKRKRDEKIEQELKDE